MRPLVTESVLVTPVKKKKRENGQGHERKIANTAAEICANLIEFDAAAEVQNFFQN